MTQNRTGGQAATPYSAGDVLDGLQPTTHTPNVEQPRRMRVIAADIDDPAALVTCSQETVLVLRVGLVVPSIVALLNSLLRDVELQQLVTTELLRLPRSVA